jgi:hypothetical protein
LQDLTLRALTRTDGQFGIFFGHTFIITDGEPECVDHYPWELTVVR